MYVYTYVYMYIYVCVYVHMYIYVYVHVRVCVSRTTSYRPPVRHARHGTARQGRLRHGIRNPESGIETGIRIGNWNQKSESEIGNQKSEIINRKIRIWNVSEPEPGSDKDADTDTDAGILFFPARLLILSARILIRNNIHQE